MKNKFLLWLKASSVRAIKTFAQTSASMITIGSTIGEIDWKIIISTSLVALIYSFVTSVAGLPEIKGEN